MSALILGCIADDFTGATDLANNLARGGMRTVVTVGVQEVMPDDADAVIVALKTRTSPVAEAVSASLLALRALKAAGARQIYFKICSTFDSTPEGNIGSVLEALMDALGCSFSVVAPAFPRNGRTVYQGYLFVHDVLLGESSMRHHPLTPMTDSNLLRVLATQLGRARAGAIGLLSHQVVSNSEAAVRKAMEDLRARGVEIAISDTVTEDDMARLAAALRDAPLVTASSGLAVWLPRESGFLPSAEAAQLPVVDGRAAILSGSCSVATNRQVQHFLASGGCGWKLDTGGLPGELERVPRWAEEQWRADKDRSLLIYSTEDETRRSGSRGIGSQVENAMGRLAVELVGLGVRRLVVAGGETSGACVQALGISRLRIGPQIDPGVPWCYADVAAGGLQLALKSGNFGSHDFFSRALEANGEAV